MSEPRQPLKEGGLKQPPETPPSDQGLSKTDGGKTRDPTPADEGRGGMIGEGDTRRDGGMAGEG